MNCTYLLFSHSSRFHSVSYIPSASHGNPNRYFPIRKKLNISPREKWERSTGTITDDG